MEKHSFIFEELMGVNKEEDKKIKRIDIKLANNAWKIKKVFRVINLEIRKIKLYYKY